MKIHTDNNNVTTTHKSVAYPGHDYQISFTDDHGVEHVVEINFQNGAVKEVGVNGITQEALLAIMIHRTKILNGNYPCKENEAAIEALTAALNAFESRTRDRIARQVEGENKL